MKFLEKKWILVVAIISMATISSALTAEFVYKILPCDMCLHQRYPYYFIIIISIIFIFFKNIYKFIKLILIELALIYGFFFSFWHVGIENKLLPSFLGCSSNINNAESLEDLKNKIINQAIVSCDEITWTILGLSAATLNLFVVLSLLIFNTILIIKLLYEKKN